MALNTVTGDHYAKYSRPVQLWTQEIVTKHLDNPKRFQSVIDLGSGTGENSRYIKQHTGVGEMYGVEINPSFLNYARKNNSSASDITYIQGDMNTADWLTNDMVGKFDLVFSSFALHWAKDIRAVFERTKLLLGEGGESFHVIGIKPCDAFSFTMKQILFDDKWSEELEDFRRAPQWQSKDKSSAWNTAEDPAAALTKILIETGHEVIRCEAIPVSYTTTSIDESKGMLQWLLPLTPFVPLHKVQEFIEDAHQIYYKYCEKVDGKPMWSNKVMVCHTRVAPFARLTL